LQVAIDPWPGEQIFLVSNLTKRFCGARLRSFRIPTPATLTEKLLLFGGAIQLAGEVKARGDRRRARSDWMAIERERGISVSSAMISFEHEGLAFNSSTRRRSPSSHE
jgi:hypothetical protein